jgi:hypothetical protein
MNRNIPPASWQHCFLQSLPLGTVPKELAATQWPNKDGIIISLNIQTMAYGNSPETPWSDKRQFNGPAAQYFGDEWAGEFCSSVINLSPY